MTGACGDEAQRYLGLRVVDVDGGARRVSVSAVPGPSVAPRRAQTPRAPRAPELTIDEAAIKGGQLMVTGRTAKPSQVVEIVETGDKTISLPSRRFSFSLSYMPENCRIQLALRHRKPHRAGGVRMHPARQGRRPARMASTAKTAGMACPARMAGTARTASPARTAVTDATARTAATDSSTAACRATAPRTGAGRATSSACGSSRTIRRRTAAPSRISFPTTSPAATR